MFERVILPEAREAGVTSWPPVVWIFYSCKKISAIALVVPITPITSPTTLAIVMKLIKNENM
jgi:hypothetical protein